MSETASSTRIKHVGTVMVPVTDTDRAIEFYTEKLGFEKTSDVPFGDGDRWVEVGLAGGETTLALVPSGENAPAGGHSRVALNTDDIEAVYAELKSRGVDVDEQIMRMPDPVPPMFWFRDQDANSHLIVQQPWGCRGIAPLRRGRGGAVLRRSLFRRSLL